jgi:hypothetical protein
LGTGTTVGIVAKEASDSDIAYRPKNILFGAGPVNFSVLIMTIGLMIFSQLVFEIP